MDYIDFFNNLEGYGMTDALLPFLLIFVICFAVLQKSQILGKGKKNFNVIISVILALLVVIPHITGQYPPNRDAVEIINNALPQVSIIMVGAIMFLLLVGLFGGEAKPTGSFSGWLALASLVLVIYIFGGEMNLWENSFFDRFGPETTSMMIIILVFAIVIWFIIRDPKEEGAIEGMKGLKDFGKSFFGKGE